MCDQVRCYPTKAVTTPTTTTNATHAALPVLASSHFLIFANLENEKDYLHVVFIFFFFISETKQICILTSFSADSIHILCLFFFLLGSQSLPIDL